MTYCGADFYVNLPIGAIFFHNPGIEYEDKVSFQDRFIKLTYFDLTGDYWSMDLRVLS